MSRAVLWMTSPQAIVCPHLLGKLAEGLQHGFLGSGLTFGTKAGDRRAQEGGGEAASLIIMKARIYGCCISSLVVMRWMSSRRA